jgi:branched-chain amino acid transport system permease protein
MGIDVARMSSIVFGIGTATAAVGGLGLAMVFPFTPQGHIRWLAWAFLVVVVGGLGSVRATLLAGLFVGLIETTSGVVLPFELVSTVVFAVLALALVLRGEGLAGVHRRTL